MFGFGSHGIPTKEINKIDKLASDGLSGVDNSLAYRMQVIQTHIHSFERWFETATTPNGEIHVADRIGEGNGAFVIDAGNDDWGDWLQILGSGDTPFEVGKVKYDFHRIEISASEINDVYFIQFAFGENAATAISENNYTETVIKPATNQVDSGPVEIHIRRMDSGTKIWARTKCPGQNTGTLSFFIGIHEYSG